MHVVVTPVRITERTLEGDVRRILHIEPAVAGVEQPQVRKLTVAGRTRRVVAVEEARVLLEVVTVNLETEEEL